MPDLEHLSLYADWDARAGDHLVRNYPARGQRTPEHAVLERLAAEGWKLVSTAPTTSQRLHGEQSHLLNFERSQPSARRASAGRTMRIIAGGGVVKVIRACPWTHIGAEATTPRGLHLKFLGVTRLKRGAPDSELLGESEFSQERSAEFTGLVSIRGFDDLTDAAAPPDLFCQFVYGNVDGTYLDDVHEPERLDLSEAGLIVGMPFGTAHLVPRVPLRPSRFEYLIFTGAPVLCERSRMLVRYRFTIAPS
ncbi:MAG: hypothetical protein IT306_30450 [Chloroflexi bacterium]|nr:hypothetical protein [Chloroflexota bacterium]